MVTGVNGYSSLNGLGLITGITDGYSSYGLSGLGAYGTYSPAFCGGLYSTPEYIERTKDSIEGCYDVSTTRQSYANKQNVESMTLNSQCQTIQSLLKDGRTDDAILAFSNAVDTVSSFKQYEGYSKQDIKTLIQNQYIEATNGSTLLGDISKYGNSSFTTGLFNSNPITMWFAQTNDKDDFKAVVTGESKSKKSAAFEIAGTAAGGAAFGTLVYAGAKSGIFGKAAKAAGGKYGLIALAGVALAAVCSIFKGSTGAKASSND